MATATATRTPAISPRAFALGALALAGLALLAFAPQYFLLSSEQRTLAGVFMFVVLAQGWNLIGGFAGYPSFGNAAFFGLGGYTTAILMAKSGFGFWLALPVAAAVGVAFAVLMGIPTLRLRGHYFAIATLGVAEGMREVVINLDSLTGGNSGITVPAVGAQASTTTSWRSRWRPSGSSGSSRVAVSATACARSPRTRRPRRRRGSTRPG
jgi:branched-chain amino acid transport system permease protein